MYNEVNLYDATLSESELIKRAFSAINMGIHNLFVSPYYLGKLRDILPNHIKLSCPVDYPDGLGDTGMRQHGCLSATNRGADFVDLVVNPIYFLNFEKQRLVDDIKANKQICYERGASLRIVLDYRMFQDGLVFSLASTMANIGIEYIIPATGQFVDDYLDNLIICQSIMNKNPSIKTIFNSPFCKPDIYQKIEKAKIYGVRLKSFELVYNS